MRFTVLIFLVIVSRRVADSRSLERKVIGDVEAADFLWCMRIQVDTHPQCPQALYDSHWREAFLMPLRLQEIQVEASLLFSFASETSGPCPPPPIVRNEGHVV